MNDLLILIFVFAVLKVAIGWRIGSKYVKAKPIYNKSFNWTVVPYYSNGKLIHEPHWIYYAQKLNLLHLKNIDEEDILKASSSLLSAKVKSSNFEMTEHKEIRAAAFFLLDKWNYLSHLN